MLRYLGAQEIKESIFSPALWRPRKIEKEGLQRKAVISLFSSASKLMCIFVHPSFFSCLLFPEPEMSVPGSSTFVL